MTEKKDVEVLNSAIVHLVSDAEAERDTVKDLEACTIVLKNYDETKEAVALLFMEKLMNRVETTLLDVLHSNSTN